MNEGAGAGRHPRPQRNGWAAAALVLLFAAYAAAGAQSPGAGEAVIQLDSGRLPAVAFPHRLHQESTAACSVCHDMFPQKRGAIQELQKKGDLEKKAVMNQNCIKCHKDRKTAGEPSGPLSCTACHAR